MAIPVDRDDYMQALKDAYCNATKKDGLISFTYEIRTSKNDMSGKYNVKTRRLAQLFEDRVWIPIKKSGGHKEFEHAITGHTVGYQNHQKGKGVNAGIAEAIFDQVQKCLDELCNKIFAYRLHPWKSEPDYDKAYENLKKLGYI